MARKKKEKADLGKLIEKYQPVMKRTGEQLSRAVKAAEEDIAKMYRVAQTHVEIQMKNIQKEKVYHDIGRHVAGLMLKGEVEIPGLEKYRKELLKIETENEKRKKKLSKIGAVRKRGKRAGAKKK